mmetsp:Transcript_40630/g.126661  ORF Transcript_40630/g.126661 Transcript_40630/m.126661 type:complete len:323 (-) Transcript_40630:101-1069(-)
MQAPQPLDEEAPKHQRLREVPGVARPASGVALAEGHGVALAEVPPFGRGEGVLDREPGGHDHGVAWGAEEATEEHQATESAVQRQGRHEAAEGGELRLVAGSGERAQLIQALRTGERALGVGRREHHAEELGRAPVLAAGAGRHAGGDVLDLQAELLWRHELDLRNVVRRHGGVVERPGEEPDAEARGQAPNTACSLRPCRPGGPHHRGHGELAAGVMREALAEAEVDDHLCASDGQRGLHRVRGQHDSALALLGRPCYRRLALLPRSECVEDEHADGHLPRGYDALPLERPQHLRQLQDAGQVGQEDDDRLAPLRQPRHEL